MAVYDIIKELKVTKGWSPLFGNCEIDIDDKEIWIRAESSTWMILNKDGKYFESGECIIFPSKDNRDWNAKLKNRKNQLLPKNSLVVVSDSGTCWSLNYYVDGKRCTQRKNGKYPVYWKYIVPVSRFDFNIDDLSVNIKNSI